RAVGKGPTRVLGWGWKARRERAGSFRADALGGCQSRSSSVSHRESTAVYTASYRALWKEKQTGKPQYCTARHGATCRPSAPAAPGGKDGLVPDPRREGGQGGGKIQIRGPALRQLRQGLRAGVEALVDGGADVGVEGVVDGCPQPRQAHRADLQDLVQGLAVVAPVPLKIQDNHGCPPSAPGGQGSSPARKEMRRGVLMSSNCTTWAPLSQSTSTTVPTPNTKCFTRWPGGKAAVCSSSGRRRWLLSM